MHRLLHHVPAVFLVLLTSFLANVALAAPALKSPGPLRLYVLDCGAIHVADTARYELRREEVVDFP